MTVERQIPAGSPGEAAAWRVYEGFNVELQPAPVIKRMLAYAADLGIIGASLYAFMIIGAILLGGASVVGSVLGSLVGQKGIGSVFLIAMIVVLVLVSFAIFDGYFIYFEYKKNGQTPGKRLFGLRVASLSAGPLTLGQIALRDLFRYVDCVMILPGLICLAITPKKQRIGDLVASTMVVHSAEREKTETFLYVSQTQFNPLKEFYQPNPIDTAVCQDFLKFAFPGLLLKTVVPDAETLARREAECRTFLSANSGAGDQMTVLLFFAECCLQTLNLKKS